MKALCERLHHHRTSFAGNVASQLRARVHRHACQLQPFVSVPSQKAFLSYASGRITKSPHPLNRRTRAIYAIYAYRGTTTIHPIMGPQPVLARSTRGKPPHYNGCVPKLATTRSSSMVHCLAPGCYWQGSTATLAASVSLSTRRLPLQPVPITACISLRMMTSRKPCGRCEALWPRLIVSIIS